MKSLLETLEGVEVAGVLKLPDGSVVSWKEILTKTFADLEECLKEDHKYLVFLWDEVPFLLDNIKKRQSPETAMEILDVLRALGQDYTRIRLVLTGSIGIHLVLNSLKEKGYINSPLNTMERKAPGPLDSRPAIHLAKSIITGVKLNCNDVA